MTTRTWLSIVGCIFLGGACDDNEPRDGAVDVPDVRDASDASDASDSDTSADSDASDNDTSDDSDTSSDSGDDTTVADVDVDPGDASSCGAAEPGGVCTNDGQRCEIGQECCCGECAPSLVCTCAGGTWACFHTDFCLRPGCPDGDVGEVGDSGDADDSADGHGPSCEAAQAALADALYATPASAFTAVVRLDHDTLALLGYALVTGRYAVLDEAAARAAAQAATGHGAGGTNLSGPSPEDAWVFYESPGDFGGVAAVSAHTGLPVFGGSIVWDGRGDITFPSVWSAPADLGRGCDEVPAPPLTRGFDLVSGGGLDLAEVDAALAPVRDTALIGAMWERGYAFDAVVLRYPRTVGAFDPTSAEWIVVVSGGWLE